MTCEDLLRNLDAAIKKGERLRADIRKALLEASRYD